MDVEPLPITDSSNNISRPLLRRFEQEVLKRYGYLQCGSRRRRNRHRGRSGGGGDGSRDHEDASSSSSPRWSCSAHELRRAVRQYQRNYNMPETGLLDEPTLRVMSEARCGNPDIEAGTLPHRKAKAKRRKRTIVERDRVLPHSEACPGRTLIGNRAACSIRSQASSRRTMHIS